MIQVSISRIREVGRSGNAIWQSYKKRNKWQKMKHRATYFVQTNPGLSRVATIESRGGKVNVDNNFVNGLNANAPEFRPCSEY